MITLTSAENALKTLYLGVVADQLNTAVNPLLARFEKTTSNVWGKEIRKLAPFGINGGIGAGDEDGELPDSASNNYAQFVLTLKNLYGTIEISDKAIRASENNAGAFVNLLEAEMEGLVKASKFNFGRMLFGDGSGVLANVVSQTGNVFTVDSVRNVMEGMVVDLIHPSTSSVIKGRRIIDVDRENKTIKVAGATIASNTFVSGDYITVQGSHNKELTGLGAIFGDSETLYGLKRSEHKWLKPHKIEAEYISDTVIQKAIDAMEEVAGSTADFIVCSAGVKRAYQSYLACNKSITDVMDLEGGYKAITYNGIPIVSDRFCPEGTMYVLNTKDFHLHQLCDWRWLEGDDGKVLKQINGKPVYSATLVKYVDLICDRPIGQAVITGITEE